MPQGLEDFDQRHNGGCFAGAGVASNQRVVFAHQDFQESRSLGFVERLEDVLCLEDVAFGQLFGEGGGVKADYLAPQPVSVRVVQHNPTQVGVQSPGRREPIVFIQAELNVFVLVCVM